MIEVENRAISAYLGYKQTKGATRIAAPLEIGIKGI